MQSKASANTSKNLVKAIDTKVFKMIAYLLQSKAKWYVLRIKNPATRSFGVCARYLNHAIKHTDTTAVSSVSPAFLYIFLYNIQPKITASQIKKNIIPSFFVHAPSAAKISERRMYENFSFLKYKNKHTILDKNI